MANNLTTLYRYSLIAASEYNKSPRVGVIKNNDLCEHVRKLFSKSQDYHDKVIDEILQQPKKNFLNVAIIEAKDLFKTKSTSTNQLIDPYCYIYLTSNNSISTTGGSKRRKGHRKTSSLDFNSNKCRLTVSPNASPAASPNTSPKLFRKGSNRCSSFRSAASNASSTEIISSNKTSCKEQTLTPCWNERFKYEITDIKTQTLIIQCYSYDVESASLLSNFTKKSSNRRLLKSFKAFFENRKIVDDFIGQIHIPLKDFEQSETKWYDLYCKHNNQSHSVKGKIRLSLELVVKLGENTPNTPDLIQNTNIMQKESTELSKESFISEYHKLVQIVMDNELTKRKKDQDEWDGSIDYLSQTLLRLFRETFFISNLTKEIIELITKMELKKYYNELLSDQKIIADLLKLANDISDNQSIILLISDYEKRKLYEDSCVYIREYFSNKNFILFPPSNENEQNITECIKLTNQIDKLLSAIFNDENLNFKKVPAEILAKRLQDDVNGFITSRINLDQAAEKNDSQLLKWMHNLNNIMEDLLSFLETITYFNNNIFNLIDVEYCKIVAITMSNCLSGPVQFVLRALSDYQTEYRSFTTNMKYSSHVSTHLFINCRELCDGLIKYIHERELFKFQLSQYPTWFKEQQIVSFWLETYKIVARDFVRNALKMEDVQEISNGDDPGITMTSVLVAQHLIVICKEWNEINFPDTETKYIGTVALTETINDTCRFFVQTLKQRLEDLNYYFESKLSLSQSQMDPIYKICILLNNIDHLKSQTISSLSSLLKFDLIQAEIEEAYSDTALSKNIRETLDKSVCESIKDMDILTVGILKSVANILIPIMKSRILSLYYNKNTNVIDHIHKNLHMINTKMPAYSKHLVVIMWNNLIKMMHQYLPLKESSQFYEFVSRNLKTLEELFISYDLPYEYTVRTAKHIELLKLIDNELNSFDYGTSSRNSGSDVSFDLNNIGDLDTLTVKLELYSKRTEDIILQQLKYLSDNNNKTVNVNTDQYYGSILFKVGYEEQSQSTVRVNIKVLFCKNLPRLDLLTKSSDPYVTVELLPKSLFKNYSVERTITVYKSLNPVYNETFTFEGIPKEVMKQQGAVLRLSVSDYDMIGGDDFAGETFYPLMYVDSMDKFLSIDMMPAIMSELKQPNYEQKKHLKELERRSGFDKEAQEFLKSRLCLIEKCELQRAIKISASQQSYMQTAKNSWNKIRSKFPCYPTSLFL